MVQNINNQTGSQFGAINKIGNTQNGRTVYQVIDANGREAGKLSLPTTDCDMFEKSYKDILEAAPKIQKFAQEHSSPEDIKKRQKASRWIVGICAAIGAGVPIYLTRKASTVKQILTTALGIVGGLTAGFGVSLATTTPPGTMKFSKATKNISKLDIQPVVEQ